MNSISIIDACYDSELFRPFLEDRDGGMSSWMNWFHFYRVMHGIPIKSDRIREQARKLILETTGRDYDQLSPDGYRTVIGICGRRSGKTRSISVAAAWECIFGGHEHRLAKGEVGYLPICTPVRDQARNLKNYIRAIFDTSALRHFVVDETKSGFRLKNNIQIEIMTGDYRTVRSYTLVGACVDEACFYGVEDKQAVRSDVELVAALEPGLLTTNGRLLIISSPHWERGYVYNAWKRHWGKNDSPVLCWRSSSRLMNPLLSQKWIDQKMAEDAARYSAEIFAEWRTDVEQFISRAVVEALVVKHRTELLPDRGRRYFCFVDMSAGRSDASCCAVAHVERDTVVVDMIRVFKSPHNPHVVVPLMAKDIARFGIRRIVGDNYAGEWVKGAWEQCGFRYEQCELPKSGLYLELLPRLCSERIQLLDHPLTVDQICSLQRRTRRGSSDTVDHPTGHGQHDDAANAVAGVAYIAAGKLIRVGSFFNQHGGF
jgi:hypothetical protein